GASGNVSATTELPESLTAPVAAGDEIGRVVYMLDGREIGSVPVIATENIDKIGFATLFWRILQQFLLL
ncbi:MAG: D-alanyl-D-alanine carboxypeptidase, partial [Clostridia bacterium]|nr:D-alanyl-D-alanine carboxypeptidase [Clostridia bacterium]